jgi:HlyD family secretion protein
MNASIQRIPSQAWSVRGPMWVGVVAMLVLFGGFGLWSVTSTLAGAVVASGRIEVDRNRQVLQHPDGGVVTELLVDEGDRVEQGAVIMRLDDSDLRTDLTVARAQLFELRVRRARLEAERDGLATLTFPADLQQAATETPDLADLMAGQANLFAARSAVFDREVAQLRGRATQIAAQADALTAQQAAAIEQLALVEEDLARRTDLQERGLTETGPILELRRAAARIRGTIGELEARQAEISERIIETELAITQLEGARVEQAIADLREIRVREEELRERAANLSHRIADLDLRAPVSGMILGLQVFGPQSVVRSADPVAFIVPEDRPLIITSQVPAIHIDQVFVGQSVTLRFPAFDMRTIPDLMGRVSQVSADALFDERTGVSYYRAEVVLNEGEIARLGDRVLVPGMPVEAYIRTEDRTPLTYLLEPFAAYFNRAFRES